jgi:hypothetical protein
MQIIFANTHKTKITYVQFHESVQCIEYNINQHVHQMIVSTQSLSRSITSQGLVSSSGSSSTTSNKFPYVTMEQTFELFANDIRTKKGGVAYKRLWYTPIVDIKDYLQWIDFSTSHSTWPIEAMNLYTSINNNNNKHNPEEEEVYSNVTMTQYKEIFLEPLYPIIFQYDTVPYNPSTSASNANLLSWYPEDSIDEFFLPIMYASPPPIVPATQYPYMNINCYTDETLKQLTTVSSTMGKIVVSSMMPNTAGASNQDNEYQDESIITIPVYSNYLPFQGPTVPQDKHTSVVAFVFAVISWKTELTNLLRKSSSSMTTNTKGKTTTPADMVVELKNTCGQSLLYELRDDSDLYYIGDGNNILYDKTYQSHKSTIMLTNEFVPVVTINDDSDNNNNTSTLYENVDCQYYIEIYPTAQFVQSFQTHLPFIFILIAIIVFTITVIVFLLYDRFVQWNNEKAIAAAARSNALVSSLFPSNVRERLLQEKDDDPGSSDNFHKHSQQQHGTHRIRNLRSFLTGNGKQHQQDGVAITNTNNKNTNEPSSQVPHQRQSRRTSIHGITNMNSCNSSDFKCGTSSNKRNSNDGSNDGSNNMLDDAINTGSGIEIYKSKPIADFFPEATGKEKHKR